MIKNRSNSNKRLNSPILIAPDFCQGMSMVILGLFQPEIGLLNMGCWDYRSFLRDLIHAFALFEFQGYVYRVLDFLFFKKVLPCDNSLDIC